jgi:hypothetical protein
MKCRGLRRCQSVCLRRVTACFAEPAAIIARLYVSINVRFGVRCFLFVLVRLGAGKC